MSGEVTSRASTSAYVAPSVDASQVAQYAAPAEVQYAPNVQYAPEVSQAPAYEQTPVEAYGDWMGEPSGSLGLDGLAAQGMSNVPQVASRQAAQNADMRRQPQTQTQTAAMAGMPTSAAGMPSARQSQPAQAPVSARPDLRSLPTQSARDLGVSGIDDAARRDLDRALTDLSLSATDALSSARELAASTRPASSTAIAPARSVEAEEARVEDAIQPEVAQSEARREAATETVGDMRPDSVWNRRFGWNPKSREVRTRQASTKSRLDGGFVRKLKKGIARRFGRPGVGYRVYGKMIGMRSLDLRDVALGQQEVISALDQNREMIDRLLAQYMPEGESAVMLNQSQLIEFINSHDVYVATFKPPNNRGQDLQRRRLRVLTSEQRGIYIHPFMAAMYTADFDGDDMEVSFDPDVASMAKDPMDHMIGIDGQQSLNMDFLPVSSLHDGYQQGKTARDYVREIIFGSFAGIDGRSIRSLVDSVLDLSETYSMDGDTQAAAYGRVFREARSLADAMNPTDKNASDDMMSRLCRSVFQGMHNIKVQNALESADATVMPDNMPDPRTYDDQGIYKLVTGMVEGAVPNNFQELKVMLTGFSGNVSGKNAPFRFTADVGKMMKMDSRLQVGDGSFVVDPNDASQMEMFFESTVKFAESRRMAKEIKKAGRQDYYGQKLRELVINDVGFPERYDSYLEFISRFVDSYHRNSSIINEANLVFLTNMGLSTRSNRGLVSPLNPSVGGLTLGDIAEPMLTVYGSYSVERMFRNLVTSKQMAPGNVDRFWKGNPAHETKRSKRSSEDSSHAIEREYEFSNRSLKWITGKYMSYNLRAFAHENRLAQTNFVTNMVRDTKFAYLAKESDNNVAFYMLMAIADKRTGRASKFNQKVYKSEEHYAKKNNLKKGEKSVVEMMGELMRELTRLDTDGTVSGRRDQMLWVDNVVEAMVQSGPDMFYHFGMDSTAGFLKSKWGRKLAEHAGNVELLGGVRTAMVFDYRMERVNALQASMPDPVFDGVDQWADTWNNLKFERDRLAASSEVWHGILREMEAEESQMEDSVFSTLTSGRSLLRRVEDGKGRFAGTSYEWDATLDAADFWRNPGDHPTLRSVIEDLDMDRETKWNVIADVVRYWENDAYLKSYEVGLQLEIGNDSSYDISSSASQAALSIHRDFQDAFNRWESISQKESQKDVSEARKRYEGTKGALMTTIQRLADMPWERVMIDDLMYADSILSVKDKTYDQTEKASQQPWTNAIYAAVSFQRNGGYTNDITRTNDRLLGIQSVASVGIDDVITLLADPDARLEVYNEPGEVGLLTRDILLEAALGREVRDLESDMWEFLEQEPRIASAIRRHSACVMADSDGSGYVGATNSIRETIEHSNNAGLDPIGHVKYLMRDHPVYAGIISLASPSPRNSHGDSVGAVTRNERTRIAAIEDYLCHRIYRYASLDVDARQAAETILSDLGITRESMVRALRSDYDSFLSELGMPTSGRRHGFDNSESMNDAITTYNTVAEYLTRYIDNDVRENVQLGLYAGEMPRKPSNVGVDAVSAASFWDVVQELSGAKTAVSTGIEGSETFLYGQWASKIRARDRYADLQAILSDDLALDGDGWDGLWTNVRNEYGYNMTLVVGEDGRLENYDALVSAAKASGVSEIVTMVPEGYTVQDRSTDSHGNPVASLFAYMVSKRSNGAEAFNLKAKKAGIDGHDSITKMQGKHRTFRDANGKLRKASYGDIQENLRYVYSHNGGLENARLELAKMLLEENTELGYKDLTLANYMCLAELMLVESESEQDGDTAGTVHLRSLEMLFSAIKSRLGTSVDDMTNDEITDAANAIINDTSEDGVGIRQMNFSLEALDGIRPKRMSSQTSGIRPSSSVFERNYDLLSNIMETEMRKDDGARPMSQDKALMLDKRMRRTDGVKSVIDRSRVTRGYNVVGFAGATSDVESDIRWTIGPSSMVVIGDGDVRDSDVRSICKRAYQLGMTVVVSSRHMDAIPSDMMADAMPCSDSGDVLVPCFDMRLNGSEAMPYNGGRFAIFQAPFSRYVVSVEDSINEHMLGDAEYRPLKNFVNRIKAVDNGSKSVSAWDMFPNVFGNPDFRNCSFRVSFASEQEIARFIAGGVRCTIDYGLVEGANGFDQRVHDVDEAIRRYQDRYSQADPDGFMVGVEDCVPGDIVGWYQVEIRDNFTDQVQYAFAPIIPFEMHGSTKGIPERFKVESVTKVDDDGTVLAVNWTNTTDVSNGFAKYFDSSGGANKGMVNFLDTINDVLTLMDGTNVDLYCAKASTDSRKVGTDRRIKTMISLVALARMHGYNFAMSEGSFPDNDEVRERMLTERIPRQEWGDWLSGDTQFLFTRDQRLNAFLNYECRKILKDGGNPSDYLMNTYTDKSGNEVNTHVMWEFEAMFDQGLNYEDGLLRFLHAMDNSFCPNGVDDEGEYLFRLARDGDGIAQGYDTGVLQMQVPHRRPDGAVSYLWDNVYIGMSFFGEDYSGFSRPNVNGASNFMDAANTAAYYGAELDEQQEWLRTMWALADQGRIPRDGGALGRA